MESLPPKHSLLEACRGTAHDDNFVLRCACRLAELHEQRLATSPTAASDIDRDRARLVHEVDQWVATQLPRAHAGARLHTETVGTVVDRLAQFSALTYLTLTEAPDEVVRDATRRMSELAVAYDDLAGEISAGLCRLPDLSGYHSYEH
ncbi:DUF4254 domain-containing protein [Nocardia sp. BMG51109]|uniref:DUF4254 domain-containing protein n=1 Tax=Nocardia sp. BMG51109 TaxID=1056816 RepID=UPI000465E1D1|nr:DUF4254 domain-containing protein [Nocardia sp. BMG51109]